MRISLAKALFSNPDLLLLDEPTNHLDIASRETLLSAIKEFQGTVIVVSHDRYFLRAIANRVFHLDKQKLTTFDGHFEEYQDRILNNLNI